MISMPDHLTVSAFNDFLADTLGIYYKKDKIEKLYSDMETVAKELHFKNSASFLDYLLNKPLTDDILNTLVKHFSVGETYFLREPAAFELLEKTILPELVARKEAQGNRCLRIWSAACSSGEEVYSLAISVHKLRKLLEGFDISIIGTDVNGEALKKAKTGIYGKWSFRGFPSWVRNLYFTPKEGNRYCVRSNIRQMVTFEKRNLVKGEVPVPGLTRDAFDIIFCRNVLMYFKEDAVKKALQLFGNQLAREGVLVLGCTDILNLPDMRQFHLFPLHSLVYRKTDDANTLSVRMQVEPVSPFLLPEPSAALSKSPVQTFNGEPGNDQGRNDQGRNEQGGSENKGVTPAPPASPAMTQRDDAAQGMANAETIIRDARQLYQNHRYNEAKIRLTTLSEGDDFSSLPSATVSAVYELLARIDADQGRLTEAETMCGRAIEKKKADPGLRFLLGTIKLEQGNIEEAKDCLGRSIYLAPGYIPAYFTLGNLALRENEREEAYRYFRNTRDLLEPLPPETPVEGLETDMTAGRLLDLTTRLMPDADGGNGIGNRPWDGSGGNG